MKTKVKAADRNRRLAMLAENLALNERLLREGKRDGGTYAVCKRDVVNRMAEIRAGKY